MAQRRNSGRRRKPNPPAPPARKRARREYRENPGWGTAFARADNRPPQPQYTGEGVLDDEIVDAIMAAGGKFTIAVWVKDNDGHPLRNKDGTRRIRVHIEAPYSENDDDQDDDDDEFEDGDDDDDFDDDDGTADDRPYTYDENGYHPGDQNRPF
jgi:hypothetical protein